MLESVAYLTVPNYANYLNTHEIHDDLASHRL